MLDACKETFNGFHWCFKDIPYRPGTSVLDMLMFKFTSHFDFQLIISSTHNDMTWYFVAALLPQIAKATNSIVYDVDNHHIGQTGFDEAITGLVQQWKYMIIG